MRPAGRLLAAAAVVVGLAALFLALIVATDGAGSGFAAWSATVGAALAAAAWRGRRRPWRGRLVPFVPVLVAAALTLTVCVPTVPTTRRSPSALAFVTTEHWRLSTGSRVAVYHYPPTGGGPRRHVPLLYLNGGPVRGISVLDHHFLRRLAGQGYDVYAYEQAGGGRSDLLPMDQYTITRSVRDLRAFVDRLGTERVDVLGFSSGAALLTRALADPATAAHLHRAVIAEPGPMDGPTARLSGRKGRPSARGTAPAKTGPRSTHVPRYAVAFGLMRLGLLSPENGLVGQAEGGDNAFTAADLGSDTASAYHGIPPGQAGTTARLSDPGGHSGFSGGPQVGVGDERFVDGHRMPARSREAALHREIHEEIAGKAETVRLLHTMESDDERQQGRHPCREPGPARSLNGPAVLRATPAALRRNVVAPTDGRRPHEAAARAPHPPTAPDAATVPSNLS
ncbi:alpha/beta fold hydrolase [Streptomyces sp. NPDC059070]|uniref:alpha/beta fold hydrolase n=1 Tax=Streptomyces sp. NPDC059070 TaxID=3346713 RepID=UPI00367C39CF